MVNLELLEEKDFETIVKWNIGKTEDFLYQWAGSGYDYPLTLDTIKKRFKDGVNAKGSDAYIFKIVNLPSEEMIGTIELACIDAEKKFGVVARFLIGDDKLRGRGLGEQALNRLVETAFCKFLLESIALKVFDFNTTAIRCYKKVGFKVSKYTKNVRRGENGDWGVYEMTLTLSAWKRLKKGHNMDKPENF